MKVTDKEEQRKIRRKASFPLLVYDLQTGLPMGQILDMSAKGMKLMTEQEMIVGRVYYCRIPFDRKIKKNKEVCFDAECRWCQVSDDTGWFNSGFLLRYPSQHHAEVVEELTRIWMADHTGKIKVKASKPEEKKGFFQRLFDSGD